MSDTLLTPAEVAKLLRVTTATLERWRSNKSGPAWRKLGTARNSAIRYLQSEIDTYLKNPA